VNHEFIESAHRKRERNIGLKNNVKTLGPSMFDHFAAGREVSRLLAAEKYGNISEQLDDSLSCGIASEALMGMQWHLSNFLESKPQLHVHTRISIDQLLNAIKVSLQ